MIPLVLAALAPLLQGLASNGLNLIGSAVMAKGKQVIEQKLGVDLDKEMQTEEGRFKLLQLQSDHEEFLIKNALENRQVDLSFYQADAQDRNSARDMETRTQESEHASWLAKNIVPILALVVVLGGGAGIIYHPDDAVRMALVGVVTMVLGFYFGTSSSSRGKDSTIAALAGSQK